MEQGETFYQIEAGDEAEAYAYREDRMAENFAREYERLGRRMVMGIYCSAHAVVGEGTYMSGDMPNMASQLAEKYPDVNIGPPKVSLADTLEEPDRSRKKTVTIADKEPGTAAGRSCPITPSSPLSRSGRWRGPMRT